MFIALVKSPKVEAESSEFLCPLEKDTRRRLYTMEHYSAVLPYRLTLPMNKPLKLGKRTQKRPDYVIPLV